MGAKGVLQSGWFRVSKIPADQRSLMTLAKVGGLVGKVMEVDENSRYRYDYVRMRIACRDVTKVPKTAEGTLGMYIIDFGFEREVPSEGGDKTLRSGIKVGEDRPNKKSKADTSSGSHQLGEQEGDGDVVGSGSKQTNNQDYGKNQPVYWSAPPKIDYKRKSLAKTMDDAQKNQCNTAGDSDGEKVHIPDSFEVSDSDSDSFGKRISKLTGLDQTGQSSSGTKDDQCNKQVWFMQTEFTGNVAQKKQGTVGDDNPTKMDMEIEVTEIEKESMKTSGGSLSPEVFIPDDSIINTQERMEMDNNQQAKIDELNAVDEVKLLDGDSNDTKMEDQVIVKRRSERLKKDAHLTTMEKCEKEALKRNLEGNTHKNNSFAVLSNNDISHVAAEMGIVLENDVFATCNLLNDLEIARNDLYLKQLELNAQDTDVKDKKCSEGNDVSEPIWLDGESSDSMEFTLVESRKKKRQNKKSVMISLEKGSSKQDQEHLGKLTKKGRKLSNAFATKNTKSKKKSSNARTHLEL